ncbi:hypothetical protein RJT34_19462 [Clitoria ternatea]|uniref:Uncharacterized protein n=1 Tax=Clitoria ternatea TaxID=43366 RepID=A0AAN9IR25_CLITE
MNNTHIIMQPALMVIRNSDPCLAESESKSKECLKGCRWILETLSLSLSPVSFYLRSRRVIRIQRDAKKTDSQESRNYTRLRNKAMACKEICIDFTGLILALVIALAFMLICSTPKRRVVVCRWP